MNIKNSVLNIENYFLTSNCIELNSPAIRGVAVRIISARAASRKERNDYNNNKTM